MCVSPRAGVCSAGGVEVNLLPPPPGEAESGEVGGAVVERGPKCWWRLPHPVPPDSTAQERRRGRGKEDYALTAASTAARSSEMPSPFSALVVKTCG
jgi:hypothetical protein